MGSVSRKIGIGETNVKRACSERKWNSPALHQAGDPNGIRTHASGFALLRDSGVIHRQKRSYLRKRRIADLLFSRRFTHVGCPKLPERLARFFRFSFRRPDRSQRQNQERLAVLQRWKSAERLNGVGFDGARLA